MKKIFLLTSLIFLISCWFQDKDHISNNILEDENIYQIKEQTNSDKQNNNPQETSDSQEDLHTWINDNNLEIKVDLSEDKKDLWHGFIIQNTKNSVILLYKNKIIKDFNLEENIGDLPFIFDEWCDIFTEKLRNTDIQITYDDKENIWNNFDKNEKIKCLQENYFSSLEIKKLYWNVFIIQKNWYEWSDVELFNSQNEQLLSNWIIWPYFESTTEYNNSIYTINSTGRGNRFALLEINNNSIKKLTETNEQSIIFWNEILSWSNPEIKWYNFKNNDLIINYTLNYQEEIQQKIIDLKKAK